MPTENLLDSFAPEFEDVPQPVNANVPDDMPSFADPQPVRNPRVADQNQFVCKFLTEKQQQQLDTLRTAVIGQQTIRRRNEVTNQYEDVVVPLTPAAALKNELGVRIFGKGGLIERVNSEGQESKSLYTLKAIAYGDWTGPISTFIPYGSFSRGTKIKGYSNIRVYSYTDADNKYRFGYEAHNVALKQASQVSIGPDGKPVHTLLFDENGAPKMTYDRRPLEKGEALYFGREKLDPGIIENLRLNGNGGHAVRNEFNKRCLISVDPYNNHEIVAKEVSVVEKMLERIDSFSWKTKDNVECTAPLTPSLKGRLADGDVIKVADREKNIATTIQYDAFRGRLMRAKPYDLAIKEEQEKGLSNTQAQQVQQAQQPRPVIKAPEAPKQNGGLGTFGR